MKRGTVKITRVEPDATGAFTRVHYEVWVKDGVKREDYIATAPRTPKGVVMNRVQMAARRHIQGYDKSEPKVQPGTTFQLEDLVGVVVHDPEDES